MLLRSVTRTVTCPECYTQIPISLDFTGNPPRYGLAQILAHIDDTDMRAHLLMHEECTCTWELQEVTDDLDNILRRDGVRVPGEHCPIHKEEQ
jgi:hypothetical protein